MNEREQKVDQSKVMTKEQMKQAECILEDYRESFENREESGVPIQWEKNQLYWEGIYNEKNPKKNQQDYDKPTEINLVNAHCEGFVSSTATTPLKVNVTGETPNEREFVTVPQVILDRVWHENNPSYIKTEIFRDLFMKGVFFVRCLWNKDKFREHGMPDFVPVNPENIFLDTSIKDIEHLSDSTFIIETAIKSRKFAEKKFPEKSKAIDYGYTPTYMSKILSERQTETNNYRNNTYVHLYYFSFDEKGYLQLIEMSSCGVILSEQTFKEMPKNRLPYFSSSIQTRPNSLWGKSMAELIIPQEEILNELDQKILANARLLGNPKIKHGANQLTSEITNEAGEIIECDDINQLDYMRPPEMPNYIQQRRNNVFYETQLATRMSSATFGVQQRGVDTASEALMLSEKGDLLLQQAIEIVKKPLGDMFNYAWCMILKKWNAKIAFKMSDDDNTYIWFDKNLINNIPVKQPPTQKEITKMLATNGINNIVPSEVQARDSKGNKMTKSAEFDIRISFTEGMHNNMAFQYRMANEAVNNGGMLIEEYRNFLRRYNLLPITSKKEEEAIRKLEQAKMQGTPEKTNLSEMPNPKIEGMDGNNVPNPTRK